MDENMNHSRMGRRRRFAAVALVAATAMGVVGAASSAEAGTIMNKPAMSCSLGRVTADAAITDHPDYLGTSYTYYQMWLFVKDGSTFRYAYQTRTGWVRPGHVSPREKFDVALNREFAVLVKRWYWDGAKLVPWGPESGVVAEVAIGLTDGYLYTGRYSCVSGL